LLFGVGVELGVVGEAGKEGLVEGRELATTHLVEEADEGALWGVVAGNVGGIGGKMRCLRVGPFELATAHLVEEADEGALGKGTGTGKEGGRKRRRKGEGAGGEGGCGRRRAP
jgi:hypothetical protein